MKLYKNQSTSSTTGYRMVPVYGMFVIGLLGCYSVNNSQIPKQNGEFFNTVIVCDV